MANKEIGEIDKQLTDAYDKWVEEYKTVLRCLSVEARSMSRVAFFSGLKAGWKLKEGEDNA